MGKSLKLWPELQQAVDKEGLPLVFEDQNGTQYALLEISVSPVAPGEGYRAYIGEFVPLFGEGETREDALLAFEEALRAVLRSRKAS